MVDVRFNPLMRGLWLLSLSFKPRNISVPFHDIVAAKYYRPVVSDEPLALVKLGDLDPDRFRPHFQQAHCSQNIKLINRDLIDVRLRPCR